MTSPGERGSSPYAERIASSSETVPRLCLRRGSRLGPDDRRIATLAIPALGALAAEPLYVLVDTAIVGHLGVRPLAALALAGALLSAAVGLCNFLAYGSTPKVGRLHAAGRTDEAAGLGQQAIILAATIGLLLTAACVALAGPVIGAMGGRGQVGRLAVLYMRIAALGLPFALIAVAGEGYLRGVSRLRLPLLILLAGNLLNALVEVLFVYGLGLGIAGSGWATVIAQSVMAAGFLAVAVPRSPASLRPDWEALRSLARTGGEIFIRTGSLFVVFILAGAILARIGVTSLAAHQIAFQLWSFLALALDALAIAAQIMISQELGAGQIERARELARRTLIWSLVVGALFAAIMIVLTGPAGRLFTSNAAVLSKLGEIWPIFALMQPLNAIVFALDGILIGAGDTRFLMWAMLPCSLLAFAPLATASLVVGWGIVGVWLAIVAFILARLLACGARFRGDGWAMSGPAR